MEGGLRVAVVGAGGVGGYFGARLARGGAEVSFIARGGHLEAIKAAGLSVETSAGPFRVVPSAATADAREVGPVDVVLLAVKLWDLESAVEAAQPLVGARTAVIALQNGVSKDEVVTRAFGAQRVLGGLCYIAASIARPGVIRHGGTMQSLVFGEHDGQPTQRAQAFLAACRTGGIDVALSTDIRRAIWEKFVFLVGLSGTTAMLRRPIGPIRGDPRTRALLHAAMHEAVLVGRAQGVPLAADYAQERLAFCDGLPADMTSSMHQDLERGGRLELPWLAGEVVARGESSGIATPANREIRDALQPYVDGAAAAGARA